jgi:hypothetical protein
MPRGFPSLRLALPRRGPADAAPLAPEMALAPDDPDEAPVGPPVLFPASIVRQVLIDATEITPIWAQPRPPAPAEAPSDPPTTATPPAMATATADASPPTGPSTPARRRRTKADGTASTADRPKPAARPRTPRTRKPPTS